ncbi:MAG: hypothetical protein KDC67_15555 [Ignavibacteriae bacterium]|nr:hypothetical protein [Ignavibacteriota bacterium]
MYQVHDDSKNEIVFKTERLEDAILYAENEEVLLYRIERIISLNEVVLVIQVRK